jgi:hypothetical protein
VRLERERLNVKKYFARKTNFLFPKGARRSKAAAAEAKSALRHKK